ncbi:hypothetical protein ACVFZR_13715 [Lacticaseibacillus paracasei]
MQDNLDFSFSELEDRLLSTRFITPIDLGQELVEDLAASFQAAVVDVLVHKTQKALRQYPVEQLHCGRLVLQPIKGLKKP